MLGYFETFWTALITIMAKIWIHNIAIFFTLTDFIQSSLLSVNVKPVISAPKVDAHNLQVTSFHLSATRDRGDGNPVS